MSLAAFAGGAVGAGAIRAGQAFVELLADDSKLTGTLGKVVNKLKDVGSAISGAGLLGAGLGGALLTPFVGALTAAVSYGDAIQDISDRLGSTSEAVSRLGYAADLSATSIEDVERATVLLNKATLAATEGTGEQAEAFQKLGIDAKKFFELEADQKFVTLAGALEGVDDSTDKASLKFALLGKSAATLGPLLDQGKESLEGLLSRSDKIGQTISSADTKAAAELKDMFDELLKLMKFSVIEIGKAFFGLSGDVKEVHEVVVEFVSQVRNWIKDNRELVVTVAAVGAGIAAGGIALTAFGIIVAGVGTGISALVTVLGILKASIVATFTVVTSPLFLIGALLAGITVAVVAFIDQGRTMGNEFSAAFDSIKMTFGSAIEGILASLKGGDFTGAFKIAWIGIKSVFAEGVLFLTQQWNKFKGFFADGFRDAVVLLKLAWNDFQAWLAKQIINLASTAANILPAQARASAKAFSVVFDPTGLSKAGIALVESIASGKTADIESFRSKEEDRIIKERGMKQAEDDRDRKQALEDQRTAIAALNAELAALVQQAKERDGAGGAGRAKQENKLDMAIQGLSSAVRGAFQSSNFSSVFAFGPVANEAKKQTGLQEKMVNELGDIKEKIGGGVFE